ncbi:MAG: hypothetical protein R6U32_04035 [Candidatus Woesearchaeota archaeon]
MIRKSTKLVIDNNPEEFDGGLPLSEGEILVKDSQKYKVTEKRITISGENVEITYILEKA